MTTIEMMVGLPCSGKSTYCRAHSGVWISSDEIRKELGVDDKKKGTKKDAKNDKDTNDGSTNPPAPNPSNEGDGGKYNLEEISKLDPRSKEYAEWRKSVGLK